MHFKHPLQGPRKPTPSPQGVYDYKAVATVYNERLGRPFYPQIKESPVAICTADTGCQATFNGLLWSSGCTGKCFDGG